MTIASETIVQEALSILILYKFNNITSYILKVSEETLLRPWDHGQKLVCWWVNEANEYKYKQCEELVATKIEITHSMPSVSLSNI